MRANWYCDDCETSIDREEIDRHEDDGHRVRGKLRPGRLLSNDPWQVGDETPTDDGSGTDAGTPAGEGDDGGGDR